MPISTKTWSTGAVLPAADLNTYVRDVVDEIDPSGAAEGDVLLVNSTLDGYTFGTPGYFVGLERWTAASGGAVASKTFTYSGYKRWRITGSLHNSSLCDLLMRVNGLSTAIYSAQGTRNATVFTESAQTASKLSAGGSMHNIGFTLTLEKDPNANGVGFWLVGSLLDGPNSVVLGGEIASGSGDITSVEIYPSAGSIYGALDVEGAVAA